MKHDLGKTPDVDPSSKKKNRGLFANYIFKICILKKFACSLA